MENVIAFNNELSGLYDTKPPISKAKMAAITKAAMRAIKFYKHVVQSVEKFILKCKPEYKVPGLYVIDSIVRQSRHQFGPEKDVFAPRFARNIKETFANLFRCAPEDKSRIIRVLNLWQKNNVFAPEVIQPIFDLADPNHPIYNMPPAGISGPGNVGVMGTNSGGALSGATTGSSSIAIAGTGGPNDMTATAANGLNNSSGIGGSAMGINVTNIDMIMSSGTSSTHLQAPPLNEDKLQNASLADLSSAGQSDNSHKSRNNLNINLRQQETHNKVQYSTRRSSNNSCDNMGVSNTVLPLPLPLAGSTSNNLAKTRDNNKFGFEAPPSDVTSSTTKIHHPDTYNKYQRNLHDFEYEDSTTATNHRDNKDDNDDSSIECESPKNTSGSNLLDNNNLKQLLNDPNVLRQLQTLQNFQKFKQEDKQHNLRMQEEAFEKHIQNVLKANVTNSSNQDPNDFSKEVEFVSEEQKIEVINLDGNDSRSPTPDRDRYKRRRSRSRSRSRERSTRRGRRSRSRTRSRTRSPRGNRRRTSRDRDRDRERINRDKERDREHERERRKRGLPDTRKEHLSVCSTTLWVGHLSKLVYQEELSDTFGEFGDIVSIDQIVPRGCAFIVMNRRQDAYKAMQSLKNHKLQGRAITISWAAGKGVKSKEWKDFWDLDLGVTYIPWHKLDEATDFDSLEEGGMFDEDSMPGWMKDKINKMKSIREKAAEASAASSTDALVGPGPPPNTVPPGANPSMMFNIDTSQPPPGPPGQGGHPPPLISMVPGQFSLAPPLGAPSRMLAPPMGMPISGIHMPPNIVQPHAAMMMMPRFGCMPGQMGGPNTAPHMGPPLIPPIGNAPPSTSHYTGPPPATPIATGPVNSNITATMNTTDDQMDIEMEDEEGSVAAPTNQASSSSNALHFNHPPPAINTSHALPAAPGDIISNTGIVAVGEMGNNGNDIFTRDRNRGVSSRWGGRGGGGGGANHEEARWREDSISVGASSSYQGGRPVPPDFMNDNRGRIGPNFNGGGNDFHPNISNRFQLPASLMQMRIPPPSAFNSRGPGGPPMFMRGQGGPGGRLQGPGPGFYNRNNPFERDGNPFAVRGVGGRGGRGGVNRGRHNWNDEEIEDCGSPFKRRIGGMGLNRFRDRNEMVTDDRHNSRGGRRGGGNSRERHDNEQRDRDFRSHGAIFNRRDSSDDTQHEDQKTSANCTMSDTEDDWDQELQEYESKNEKNDKEDTRNCKAIITDVTVVISGNDSTQCVVKNDSKFNEVEEEEEEEYRLEPSTSTEELNADILTPVSSFGSKNFEESISEPAMCDELPSEEFAESNVEPVTAEALSTSANTLTKMAAEEEEEEAESLTVAGEVDNTNDTEV